MRDYPLKLDGYGISKHAFLELHHFCLQYPDKKVKLACKIKCTAGPMNDMPHASGTSDPTGMAVIMREREFIDCHMIEQSAIETSPELYQYIIKNVTLGEPFYRLNAPCCAEVFSNMRRRFFYILWQKRNQTTTNTVFRGNESDL